MENNKPRSRYDKWLMTKSATHYYNNEDIATESISTQAATTIVPPDYCFIIIEKCKNEFKQREKFQSIIFIELIDNDIKVSEIIFNFS